jgi:copper chaperone CopZ
MSEKQTVDLAIKGMSCGHCVKAVQSALAAVPGVAVKDVRVGHATVEVDRGAANPEALVDAVDDAGYEASVE